MNPWQHSLRGVLGTRVVLPEPWESQWGDSPWLMVSLNWPQHNTVNWLPPSRGQVGHNQGVNTIYTFSVFSATTGFLLGGQFAPLFWTCEIKLSSESWILANFGSLFLVLAEQVYLSLLLRNAIKETLMSLMHTMPAAKQSLALTCPSKGEAQMLAPW